jgi:peptide/nickel transport system permease protein
MTSTDATLAQPVGLKAWLRSETPSSGWQAGCIRAYRGWRAFARNPMGLLGLAIVLLLFFCAAFAPWISTADPTVQDLNLRLQPSSADHWLGTDRMGRDTYSAVIYGARATL